jgi:hypothetical protein
MPYKTGKPHDSEDPIGRHVDIYKTDSTGKRAKDSKHYQDLKVSYDETKPIIHDINPPSRRMERWRVYLDATKRESLIATVPAGLTYLERRTEFDKLGIANFHMAEHLD